MAHASVPLKVVPHVTYSARDSVAGRDASTSLGGWEVTAGFDPIRCEVYCTYRQKTDASGRTPAVSLLAPPITIVEVYTDLASKPAIVIFDPAGLGLPAAAAEFVPGQESPGLPGRKIAFAPPATRNNSHTPVSSYSALLLSSTSHKLTPRSVLSLRI
jgi:hypothetical protein